MASTRLGGTCFPCALEVHSIYDGTSEWCECAGVISFVVVKIQIIYNGSRLLGHKTDFFLSQFRLVRRLFSSAADYVFVVHVVFVVNIMLTFLLENVI